MSFLTLLADLGPALAIVSPVISQIEGDAATLAAGQVVNVPEIRTYILGKHLAVNVTVREILETPKAS